MSANLVGLRDSAEHLLAGMSHLLVGWLSLCRLCSCSALHTSKGCCSCFFSLWCIHIPGLVTNSPCPSLSHPQKRWNCPPHPPCSLHTAQPQQVNCKMNKHIGVSWHFLQGNFQSVIFQLFYWKPLYGVGHFRKYLQNISLRVALTLAIINFLVNPAHDLIDTFNEFNLRMLLQTGYHK